MRALAVLLLVSCSGGQEADDDGQQQGSIQVEVGTGASSFEKFDEGQRLDLVAAPQVGGAMGPGFHFNAAVRTKGLDPSQAIVAFAVTRRRDGASLSETTQQVNLISDGERNVGFGFRAAIEACFEVAEEELTFSVSVQDKMGQTGGDERRFKGPMFCPR